MRQADHADKLDGAVTYERDFSFDYFGCDPSNP